MMSIVPGNVELWLSGRCSAPMPEPRRPCVARGMLRRDEQGSLTFRHELARQATLDRLPPTQQRSLHAKVEAAMAELPAALASVLLSRRVHHAAGAEDGARVLELAPQAAAQAARLGAHQQAASYLATALRYVASAAGAGGAAPRGLGLRGRPGAAQLQRSSRPAPRHRDLARARAHRQGRPQSALAVAAALVPRRSRAGGALRRPGGARAGGPGARAGTGDGLQHALAAPHAALPLRRGDRLGERAIALADELGEVETRVHALNNVGTALLFADRPGGRERMEESLALALEHGFHEQAARAYTNFAEYAVVFKDFELAERLLAEGIAFAPGTTSMRRRNICSAGRRSSAWSRGGCARPRRLRRASWSSNG